MSRKITFYMPTVDNEDNQTPRFRQSESLEFFESPLLDHQSISEDNFEIDEQFTSQMQLLESLNIISEQEEEYAISQSLIIDYVPYINVNIIRPYRNFQDTAIQSQVITAPEQEQTCAICYEDLKIGDKTVILSCPHLFHSICIKEWFKVQQRRKCPMCRQFVTLK